MHWPLTPESPQLCVSLVHPEILDQLMVSSLRGLSQIRLRKEGPQDSQTHLSGSLAGGSEL